MALSSATSALHSLEEVQAFLDRESPHLKFSTGEARRIAELLEYQPLAVSLAAAYMGQKSIDSNKYTEIFRKHRQHRLSTGLPHRELDVMRPIYVSFHLCLDLVREENARSVEILSLMSVLDVTGIPEPLLYKDGEFVRTFHAALRKLKSFSLIQSSSDGFVIRMNQKIQACVQYELEKKQLELEEKWNGLQIKRGDSQKNQLDLETEQYQIEMKKREAEMKQTLSYWQRYALKSLADRFPWGGFSYWRAAKALLPHAHKVLTYTIIDEDFAVDRAKLLTSMASYDTHQGHEGEAYTKLEEARKIYTDDPRFGEESRATLEVESSISKTLYLMEKFKEAEKHANEHLEKLERIYGPDHPYHSDTLKVLGILAILLHRRGEFEQAEQCYNKAINAYIESHYEGHTDVLTTKNNL
jgi:tetratricopeptide (TPR) repeat protein